MANYYAKTRTNYFKVKDEAAFYELMGKLKGDEDSPEVITTESGGEKRFGFMCESSIAGLAQPRCEEGNEDEDDDYEEDADWEAMADALQGIVAEDDAIIMTEIGSENMRYLTGIVTVITSHYYESKTLEDAAYEIAHKALGNTKWTTENSY